MFWAGLPCFSKMVILQATGVLVEHHPCVVFQICEELMTRCLAPDCQMGGLGCDNMTVTLICLTPGGMTYPQLAARCSRNLPDHLTGGAEACGKGDGGGN
jgi:hypothetical protein